MSFGIEICYKCKDLIFPHVIHICDKESILDMGKCKGCETELTNCNWAFWITDVSLCRDCIEKAENALQ